MPDVDMDIVTEMTHYIFVLRIFMEVAHEGINNKIR
jgi:hypothetical protein